MGAAGEGTLRRLLWWGGYLHGDGDLLQRCVCLGLLGPQECALFRRPALQVVHQGLGLVQLGHARLQPQTHG